MFDNNVSVLIPFKAVNEYREKNLSWIKKRYETIMPNAEICIGYHNGEPFSKAAAINSAAKKATRDIFIIADSDIAFNIDQIKDAIEALNFHPWVVPYRSLIYLNLEKTNELYQKDPSIILNETDFERCSKIDNVNGFQLTGGINVVPRNYFEKIGGFDERFKGWGGEDDAFIYSLDTIFGEHFTQETTMWHLYHPLGSKEYYGDNVKILEEFYYNRETLLRNFNNRLNKN